MDTSTRRNEWRALRTVLRDQGRTLRWLALQTGRPPRTVYAYSQETLIPTPEWLEVAARVLGQEVAA